MNLSWLPLWWLRKYVPPVELSWTPAETIRQLSKAVKRLEAHNEELYREWHKCETELRAERMARVADQMSPEQKQWAQEVMGVKFRGSETN